MRNAFVVVVAALLVVYVGMKLSTMLKMKSDLSGRVEYRLDFVDERSMEQIKQDLVSDAGKIGIELLPANIRIVYRDTEQQTYAQKLVGGRLGAAYANKQVGIDLNYEFRILGYPVRQTITATKIKQVAAPALPARREVEELLDTAP